MTTNTTTPVVHTLNGTKVGAYKVNESLTWDGSFHLAIQDLRDGQLITLEVDLETHSDILDFLLTHPRIGSLPMLQKQCQ